MSRAFPDVPRPDVPVPIAVLRDFVNTEDRETGVDSLATREGLADHLASAELLPEGTVVTARHLQQAVTLRAALRRALERNHDGSAGEVPDLAEALAGLRVRLTWSPEGATLEPDADGVPGALAAIGVAVHDAVARDLFWRLKICSSDECEWAYYDHSKNRSRHWCEYGCGNRVKTRAYRARRRAATP